MNQLLIYGPLVIGPLLAYLLFGAYLVQLGQYVLSPVESERWTIYAAVAVVTLLETACMVLMSVYTWKALFTPGGPYYVIVNSNWSPTSPALYGLVAVIVHMFFAWKIKALGRNRWVRLLLPCIIFVLTITQFAASTGMTVQFSVVNGVNIKPDILRPTVILQRVASLACDTLITLSMIAILLNYKSSTRLRATQKLLNGLIINSVENGAVTVVVLALSLGLYLWHPNDFLHVALYANVLLASLNGRTLHKKWERRFASEAEDDADTAIPLYDSDMVTPGERYQTPRWPHRVLLIAMKGFSVKLLNAASITIIAHVFVLVPTTIWIGVSLATNTTTVNTLGRWVGYCPKLGRLERRRAVWRGGLKLSGLSALAYQ